MPPSTYHHASIINTSVLSTASLLNKDDPVQDAFLRRQCTLLADSRIATAGSSCTVD